MRVSLVPAVLVSLLLLSPLSRAGDSAGPPAAPDAGGARDDGRRTAGRLLSNFGRDTVFLFSTENFWPFVAGAALTGASAPFDSRVKNYFAGPTRRAKWWGDTADTLGSGPVVVPVTAGLFGLGRLVSHDQKRFRDMTYDFAEATLVTGLYVNTLKIVVRRERPNGLNAYSFPLGHAATYSTWATVIAHHYGAPAGVGAFLLASFVGGGRLEKNEHYLSDVVAGTALGVLCGRTVVREDSRPLSKPSGTVSFGPEPGALLGGRVTVAF